MHRFVPLTLAFPALFLLGTIVARAQEPAASYKDDGAPLPNAAAMEKLAKENAVALLENSMRRMLREVKGYSLILEKQEQIDRRVHPREICEVHFREKPHTVYMSWVEGARRAERVLFVEGENDGQMLARPAGKLARLVAGDVVLRDPEGEEARQSSRYSLKEFGIKKGTERTWVKWKAAQEKGTLKVEYLGVQKVKDLSNRPCWVLKRTNNPPEADGSTECTIYVDTENWMQVGSVLKGPRGQLIGAYWFRDIRLNPEFKDKQFDKAALVP